MMNATIHTPRAVRMPVMLTIGFRPFFLAAALWAVLAMVLWIAWLAGAHMLATHFAPGAWHVHEFLFGYLSAVIAGFLLTALPNWTGRRPVAGWPLAALVALWVLARVVVAVSAGLPLWLVAIGALAMPLTLCVVVARQIAASRNWRNLIVLAAVVLFACGDAVFLWQDAHGVFAAQSIGLRIGLAGAIMLTAIIGGRVVPAFTRNWLMQQGPGKLPTPPMRRFDWLALAVLALAFVSWIAAPRAAVTAGLLVLAGVTHLVRLSRWASWRTRREPLLWVLHVGYAMIPLGALVIGAQIQWPDLITEDAARHLWLAGAIGIMTLAMMTRATLGHSGQPLQAGAGTVAIYLAVAGSVLARVAAGIWSDRMDLLYQLSGTLWIAGFTGFAVIYGPLMLRARR